MGHSERASALAAITKVILCYEYGLLLPNINFEAFPVSLENHTKKKFKVSLIAMRSLSDVPQNDYIHCFW